MDQQRIKVGPFTWERRDNGDSEAWDLVQPKGVPLTHWAVKNYGGDPNDSSGFSGWRLVSGGPFVTAGGWTSREDAMLGVIPYLMARLRGDLKNRLEECTRVKATLTSFEKALNRRTHGTRNAR
jgi:hypothetical protein